MTDDAERKGERGADPERTEPMDTERTDPMDVGAGGSQDWSRFDPFESQREARRQQRDAFDAARDAARAARDATRDAARAARDATRDAARDAQRQARDAERDRERDREREREGRRSERERHRAEWRSAQGPGMRIDIDAEGFASRFMKGFVSDATGDAFSETASEEFTFDKMPRLRVRNISGETVVRAGEPGKISVIARKHVYASSEDRAKRLLQNLEIRMEKHGDELRVEPHLYEQERGWVDLFRGKRFRVDFEISVPPECAVDAQTVSGELNISGIRGPVEAQTVSGEMALQDIEGPLRLKSVSGDVTCRRYVGHIEGNTVSGDVEFDMVRVRSLQLHTVSGDIELRGVLEPAREHRLRTISGDVELSLSDPDLSVEFRTASGDLECEIPARVTRQSRKEYLVGLGQGRGHAVVKTVSGDLTIGGTALDVPGAPSGEEPMSARGAEWAEPGIEAEPAMEPEPPAPPEPPVDAKVRDEVKGVLDRLAKGELNIDDAAAALDAARGSAAPRGQR